MSSDVWECRVCKTWYRSKAAADACAIGDDEDDREAAYTPRRDPNIIRVT